jgi:mannose-6-phosphate isomerase-like protein (cupin superfamily)
MGGTARGADKIAHEVNCRFPEIPMRNASISNPARRKFLRAVPAVAAAGFTLTRASIFPTSGFASSAAAQATSTYTPPFRLFEAQVIQNDLKALAANPGNNNLVEEKTFVVVLTTEKAKTAAEFEWHEHRDHIFQILDGSTVYEIGGTPKGEHSKGPGEWLAPESEHYETFTLNKGDMLVIARGTPHRRITAGSVTFSLISPQGEYVSDRMNA